MKKNWWKALGAALMLWALSAGLLVPLKPGLYSSSPTTLKAGQAVELDIRGYNVSFDKDPSKLRVWLKLSDDEAIMAKKTAPLGPARLSATFELPPNFPSKNKVEPLTLIVDSPVDGPSILPSAATLAQDSLSTSSDAIWRKEAVSGLSFRKDFTFPYRNILAESIRNLFYHVPLWFAMMILFGASVFFSARFLMTKDPKFDHRAVGLTEVGTLFGVLGLITGAIWAKNTWGAYWSWDVKQNTSAICVLIYMAYFVLRGSFDDEEKQARMGAVYNIFAFSTLIPLLFIIPRMAASLHPGNGGNPALGADDLDNTMRLVFYPAIIGTALMGAWMAQLRSRILRLREKALEN